MPSGKMDHHGKDSMNPSFGPGDPSEPILHPKSAFVPAPPVKGATMSLAELEQLAMQHNPTLVEAALLVEASSAKAQQARLWPNPIVGYLGDQINQKGTAGEFQGGFISQEIITAHKRQLSGAKYDQQARTAEFRSAEQQLKVLNGVRMHYFKTLAAARRIGLRQALLDNAVEEYRTTLEAFNTGFKNKAQVLLAENEMRKAQVELQTEKNHYDLLWRELATLVGVPDLPCAGLAGPLEPQGSALDWHASLARILEDSPELLAARSHVAFDQLALKREKAETISNVTVKGAVGYNFPDRETVSQLQIQIQPRIWNRNQGNIRQVQADLARAAADVRRVELSLQQRLAQRYDKYQNTFLHVDLDRNHNVPAAFQAYLFYLDQYRVRRIEWLEVLRLRRNWLMLQFQYLQDLQQLRHQEVAITGLLAVDGLDEPQAPPPQGHLQVSPQPR
ncbi:MAG TPA: TolC family protein [Gemmataceae bacterium]|nr:TolC family protein [Gemmataceae bacterium]